MSVLLVVAAAIVNAQDQILLSKRPAGKAMAGMWEFPGGKIESGETPEEALARELFEEIDITAQPTDFAPLTFASHGYPDFHLLMPFYLLRTWQGTPTPKENQTLHWFTLSEIDAASMPPPDGALIDRVREVLNLTSKHR